MQSLSIYLSVGLDRQYVYDDTLLRIALLNFLLNVFVENVVIGDGLESWVAQMDENRQFIKIKSVLNKTKQAR